MSSDSSDDENLELLKEAVDPEFINDSMFKNEVQKALKNLDDQKPASLRQSRNQGEQFTLLNVTPEFQSYVGKQLATVLEKKLQDISVKNLEAPAVKLKKKKKYGIKLFGDSQHFIRMKEKKCLEKLPVRGMIRKRQLEDCCVDFINEKNKVRAVSVKPEDILSKKDIQFWSSRSKAEVFSYRKTKNGQLVSLDTFR